MRFPIATTVSLALALAAGFAVRAAPERWTRFVSSAGFSVDRPEAWISIDPRPDLLHIVSGPCRLTAVIICHGESQIVVVSAPAANPKPSRLHACWSMEETSKDDPPLSPGHADSILSGHTLTCVIGDRRFTIRESHWRDDRNSARYERTAFRMAKSLRYPAQATSR